MNTLQRQVKDFMLKAGQDCPEKPTIPDETTRILRVRLLLEEILEFAEASGVELQVETGNNSMLIENYSFNVVKDVNLLEICDSCADINYVLHGASTAYGIDLEPFDTEVNLNNHSKFIDGYRDENGKWRKGPSYKPVDLKPILEAQLA